MKKYSVLIAVFLFSCTSEIESPDSIWERQPGYDVLLNKNFAGGMLSPWEKGFGNLSTSDQGKIYLEKNPDNDYDAKFEPSGKEVNDWDLQLLQRNLKIKPGYSYKFEFGGNTTKGGTAPVKFVLMNCVTVSDCRDYKDFTFTQTLNASYADYKTFGEWKNCSETSNSSFAISGGKSKVEFKISWVNIWAQPISCP